MLPAVHNLLVHAISERHISLSEHKNPPHTNRYHSYSLFFFYHNAPRWQSFKNIFIPFPIFLAGGTYLFSELLFPRALLCCAMYITETSPETTAICQNICLVLRRTQLQFYDLKVLVLFRLFSVICHFLTIFCFWPYLLFHLH